MSFGVSKTAGFAEAGPTVSLPTTTIAADVSASTTAMPPPANLAKPRGISATEARTTLCCLLALGDMVIPVATGFLAWWLTFGFVDVAHPERVTVLLGALLSANYLHLAGLYGFERVTRWRIQMAGAVTAWMTAFATLAALAASFGMMQMFSSTWAARWLVLTLFAFLACRGALFIIVARLHRQGILALKVAIVDMGGRSQQLRATLQGRLPTEVKVLGIFQDQASALGVPSEGKVDDLVSLIRRSQVDEVIVACPGVPIPETVLGRLGMLPVNVRVWGDLPRARHLETTGDVLTCAPLLTVFERPLSGWNGVVKRIEDVVLSGAAVVIFGPVMLFIALAIKLESRGPVIFRQQRFGFNSDEITVYKFRTMVPSAAADPACAQAKRRDPRITRVGRFLRRTSLDELPQLLNVLKGDMSLVGPRPHAVSHNEYYVTLIDGYLGRHRVKPGITGWAQVNGFRGETDSLAKMQRRIDYDLYYIDRWSLSFDIKILLKTLMVGFVHRNAY